MVTILKKSSQKICQKSLLKKLYYNDTTTSKKNHPEEFWKFINSVIPSKHSAEPSLTKLSHTGTGI